VICELTSPLLVYAVTVYCFITGAAAVIGPPARGTKPASSAALINHFFIASYERWSLNYYPDPFELGWNL